MPMSAEDFEARIEEVTADLERSRASAAPSRSLDVGALLRYLAWLRRKSARAGGSKVREGGAA